MNRIAIDLELHSDGKTTGKIIQLGYSIFNTETSEVLYTGGDFIQTGEPLSDYIISLTGIQERYIQEQGVTLQQAYENMYTKCEEFNVRFAQIIEWGSGDVSQLKEELGNSVSWKFGRASLNLKAVYQMFRIANRENYSGGLKRSIKNLGKEFQSFKDPVTGRMRGNHDARADALNTALMYLYLQKEITIG